MKEEEYPAAKKYALRRLSLYGQSSQKLHDAMVRKQFSEHVIERIIVEFQELGYLNDEEFFRRLIEKEISRCRGPRWIEQKLFIQGIQGENAKILLNKYFPHELQLEKAQQLINNKKPLKNIDKRKLLFKNGFDSEIV